MTRQPRERRSDTIRSVTLSATETACSYAVASLDRIARDMEAKWGIDRLPELVPVEMAGKFGKVIGLVNEAIRAQDVEAVAHYAASAIRGWQALDAAATAAGHKPLPPECWMVEHDGWTFAILKDGAQWPAMKAAYPDVEFFDLRAVGAALWAQRNKIADMAAEHLHTTPRAPTPLEKELNDAIIF